MKDPQAERINKIGQRANRPIESQHWVWLQTALTSTSWDGDAHSTTAKTAIDLSAVFGVPAGVRAVAVRVDLQDSGAAGVDCWLILGPNSTAFQGIAFGCHPANDRWSYQSGVIPCDTNGDMYYQTGASGASTLDVTIQIWGYLI